MTKDRYPLLVTRNAMQSYPVFSAFMKSEQSTWLSMSGFPRKNGEGTDTKLSLHPFSPSRERGEEIIATIHLPKSPSSEENESLAVNTFWVVLHVLAGCDPDGFLGMRRYRLFTRELGRMFKQAWDEGRIPVEIDPSDKTIMLLQDIVTLSLRGIKRPSCVF